MTQKTALVGILLLGLVVACSPAARRPQALPPGEPEPEPEDVIPGPLEVTLRISGGLREADEATLLDALNTWEEATNGQVRIEAVFDDQVQCGQDYAIHLAEPETCGMTCDRVLDTGELTCADGESLPVWRITLRKGLELDRLYYNAVHEIGHALGLSHGEGFMRLLGDDLTATFLTPAQLDRVAEKNHLDRAAMPAAAAFAYQSHRTRLEPFLVYTE